MLHDGEPPPPRQKEPPARYGSAGCRKGETFPGRAIPRRWFIPNYRDGVSECQDTENRALDARQSRFAFTNNRHSMIRASDVAQFQLRTTATTLRHR